MLSTTVAVIGSLGIGGGIYGYYGSLDKANEKLPNVMRENSDSKLQKNDTVVKPSRVVTGPNTDFGLDLLLYQYQTCPFCCKVRAFLDYHGISYKIVEVNPVMRQQLKFSKYKKVPILIAEEKDSDAQFQLKDSSTIISILGTYLLNIHGKLQNVLQYYTPLTSRNEEGKEVDEVLNQYFLMFGANSPQISSENLQKETKWRKWADKEFVHLISPNIYRTYDEALQAFNYFSVVGEWEKNFSTFERMIVIYVGASAMYLVGKKLKKKYTLKDNVRESLYDASKLWMREIGKQNTFMGGNSPNLADLAVYGMLSSIEGCSTFKDLLSHTNIGSWYYKVKEAVDNHHGYCPSR